MTCRAEPPTVEVTVHELERQFGEREGEPFRQRLTTVLAVSGGSDSMALLRLMQATLVPDAGGGELVVAHINHRWSPDADEVATFVQRVAHSMRLACDIQEVTSSGVTSEEAARHQRYQHLTEIAHRRGARYLVTGHTADDQAETILFHILRGTGLRGLAGIPAVRSLDSSLTLKRPLLAWRRSELRAYLADIGQEFAHDPSNVDMRFTRNQLRHDLLPRLSQMFPGDPRDALCRLSGVAREAMEELQPTIEKCLDDALRSGPSRQLDGVVLHCPTLAKYSPLVIREALALLWQRQGWPLGEMTHRKWVELASLAVSPDPTTKTFPGGIRVVRSGESLQLAPESVG